MRSILLLICLCVSFCVIAQNGVTLTYKESVGKQLREQVLAAADEALHQEPITVTASVSPRSAGGVHDFYSEGDYWWPNPASPDSPYVQRDGMTNPGNFVAHRQAMIRFSQIVGSLSSAFILTGQQKYADHALSHCKSWFVDTATKMNPHLLYAQAIKGRVTGRGIGIIDAVHLMEVAMGLMAIEKRTGDRYAKELKEIRKWFTNYITWVTTHKYGKDEMNAENNHGTCWVMQVAVFAKFTGDKATMQFCRDRYKNTLLPGQMAEDGSFPRELRRTKPYGYAIFNLDAMATICQVLSTKEDNLWTFQAADGRSIRKGIEYLYPYIVNKSSWPLKPDVMYWEEWPVAQPFLVFGAIAFNEAAWFMTWEKLEHNPSVEEVTRNLPVRNPLLWID